MLDPHLPEPLEFPRGGGWKGFWCFCYVNGVIFGPYSRVGPVARWVSQIKGLELPVPLTLWGQGLEIELPGAKDLILTVQ